MMAMKVHIRIDAQGSMHYGSDVLTAKRVTTQMMGLPLKGHNPDDSHGSHGSASRSQ